MQKNNPWSKEAKGTITRTKYLLANLSIKVRTDQFKLFEKLAKPTSKTRILDVGVTSDETLKDSNMFEKLYRWQNNLTVATIEEPVKFRKLYPKTKVIKITPHSNLPFKDKSFDVVVSWATLEHVGGYKESGEFYQRVTKGR